MVLDVGVEVDDVGEVGFVVVVVVVDVFFVVVVGFFVVVEVAVVVVVEVVVVVVVVDVPSVVVVGDSVEEVSGVSASLMSIGLPAVSLVSVFVSVSLCSSLVVVSV